MIHYEIDTTENEYSMLQGNIEDAVELKEVLFSDGYIVDCVGYIHTDENPNLSLCVAAVREYGVFLGFENKDTSEIYLSLNNRSHLNEVVDVWGDDLNVSRGLFISPELAWHGICEFITSGNLYKGIEWIDTNEIPEKGNYII